MGCAYKNFWSLNTDEAVVAGILRNETGKNREVLLPLNAQMKGVDLVLLNVKDGNAITIQVKGSRAYEPQKSEVKRFGSGSGGWFFWEKDVVEQATADYFIFLIYVLEEDGKIGRRIIAPHTITIPTVELKKLSKNFKKAHGDGRYSYKIWVNPETAKAFDFRDELIDFSEYLDKAGFNKLNNV